MIRPPSPANALGRFGACLTPGASFGRASEAIKGVLMGSKAVMAWAVWAISEKGLVYE